MALDADFTTDRAANHLLTTRPTTLAGLTAKALCIRALLESEGDQEYLDVVIEDLQHLSVA